METPENPETPSSEEKVLTDPFADIGEDEEDVEEDREVAPKGDSGGDSDRDAEEEVSPERELEEPEKEEEEKEVAADSLSAKLKEAEVFKKFPELKSIVEQHEEYIKLFPTVEVAQQAAENNDFMERLTESVNNGDPELLIQNLKNLDNKEAYTSFIKNLLPEIKKIDKEAYIGITVPILKDTIRFVKMEGKKLADAGADKSLYYAAGHIAKFLFDDTNLEPDRTDPSIENERKKLQDERKSHYAQRFNEFKEDTYSTAYNKIISKIKDGLDPEGVMSERTRSAVVNDIFNEIESTVRKDEVSQKLLRTLWKEAQASNFSRAASDKIVSTYYSRFAKLIPSFRDKIRSEYLKTSKSSDPKPVKKHITQGSEGRNKPNMSKVDSKKRQTVDSILND